LFKFFRSTIKSAGKGVYKDPEFQKVINKFPRFSSFIKKRLTPDYKFGLYLTSGMIIALIFIILFFSIIQDLLKQDLLIQADLRIINLVQIFRSSSFNGLMLFITNLGKGQIIFAGMAIAGIILALLKRWRYLTVLIISVIGGEIFVWIIKNIFERPRPPLANALMHETGFSFPSGHTFMAIAFYGLITYFFYREFKNRRIIRLIIFILGILIISAIGFSRIYLGLHWPSDILASFVSGAAWLTILITVLEIQRKFNLKEEESNYKKSKIIILSIIFFAVWLALNILLFKAHPLEPQSRIPEKQVAISAQDIPDNLFSVYPRTSESITGAVMEPISLVIIGSEPEVRKAFEQAGWYRTDPFNFKSIEKFSFAAIFDNSYPTAPGIPSFWNARPNDLSYGKPTEINSVSQRQHIHCWKTPFIFNGLDPIWFCNAHFDEKITFNNSFLPHHSIDPAIDKEREKVKNDLAKTGNTEKIKEFQIVEPTINSNMSGDQFFTDGKAYVIFLNN
jgi:membrane-associated phospholipid phosphatase